QGDWSSDVCSSDLITRPLSLVRLDRIDDPEDQVQDPTTHAPKPDRAKHAEKSPRRRLIVSVVRLRGNGRKHENERKNHSHKENNRIRGMPEKHLQRMKGHKTRVSFH